MKSTNRTTSDIRAAGRQIRAAFIELGRASYRGVAERIGRSKSCLHRHEQARRRRNQYAESALWESPAGEAWLQTLFFATLYVFGLQGHVGADRLEEFFRLLRLETH